MKINSFIKIMIGVEKMPRTKEQYAQMRDASNQKIRTAAIRLFAEKGFAATNIQDIAESAGISMGLMYRHYPSKDVLVSSLLESAMEGNKDIIQSMESDGDPREIFDNLASEIYRHMTDDDSNFVSLMLLITQGLMSKSLIDCGALIDLDIQTLKAGEKLIRRGQKAGVFGEGNPKEMIVCFFSCIQGLVMMKSALGEYFQMPDAGVMTAFLYRSQK
jgi:AcrR family transcriptional regulator